MTFEAEGEYTGVFTSCDYNYKKRDKWLVYAYNYNNKLIFFGICSNSRRIEKYPVTKEEKRLFKKANNFNLKKYIFEFEIPFNYCKNITNIAPILEKAEILKYEKDATVLSVFVDKKGNAKSVRVERGILKIKDPTLDLMTKVKKKKDYPISNFEKDAIRLIRKVKKWEVKNIETVILLFLI